MVGGRQVLLSIAVLSDLGFASTLGGRHRRQDGPGDSAQSAPGGSSSSTWSQGEAVSLSQPTATVTIVATPPGDGSARSAQLGEATSGPLALTSTGNEFAYSGGFGVGGTLTTDTQAPTRTSEPTKTSAARSSEPTRGLPPADETRAPLTKVPPTRATGPGTAVATLPRGGPPKGGPPKLSTVTVIQETTESIDLGYGSPSSSQTTFVTSTRNANQTFTYSPSGSVPYCLPSDLTAAPTSWSVVHTSTITWYGDPEDYTQPYPPISTPQPTASCIIPVSPPTLTISVCASTGTDSKYKTCDVTTTKPSYGFGVQTTTVPPVVFITTDKNPVVIYSSIRTPNYGVSQEPKTRDNHASPIDAGRISTPIYHSQNPPQAITDSALRPTPTPVTVAVQPTAVVINGNTIRDNSAQQTQVVIIADQTFTIDPTRVIGAGATIDRPLVTGGVFVPVPTSTNLGSVPVVVSSSVAIIGGSSFTLGPTPTVATVSGQTFTIGPSAIAVSTQILPLPTLPSPTEVVVAGGDLITAIGRSVLVVHGTTLTYTTATVVTIDDDEITLGPGGVTLTGQDGMRTTLGGGGRPQDNTQYALVGGATITKVGASVVVIRNVTYTVGPAATGTTTTVVGGESVTVAPNGVTAGTLTMAYPFGVTTVITPGAGVGAGAGGASATGGSTGAGGSSADGGGVQEDGGAVLRPWLVGVAWAVGVAVGVGLMMG